MFDITNWVACLNGENGPGGTPSHEALSVSPQGGLEISSVAGQPPSTKKKVTHKSSRVEGVFLGPSKFQGPVSNQTVLVATDNSTVVAYINKQGGTHSAEMCVLLWKIMTWCYQYQITLKASL